jgi:predicted transposase YdaD
MFVQLLRSFVKEGWVDMIDESTITEVNKSYILQDFNQKEADVVYRVDIKGRQVIFYILTELQSTVDFQMPYRLLLYMVEIWRDMLRNTKQNEAEQKDFKLPAIIPMVLYNGAGNWTAKINYKETLSGYELFEEYVLNFKYILIDVNRFSKEDLAGLRNLIGTVFLLDQKYDLSELYERLGYVRETLSAMTAEEFNILKPWLMHIFASKLEKDERGKVEEIINQADIKEVDKMISNFERTLEEALQSKRAEGKAEGRAEGKVEGRAEGKAELVLRLLRKKFGTLSEDYTERIKKQDDAVLDAIADDIFEISDISQLEDYLVR